MLYLTERTRDSTSSRMAITNTTTAAGGGGDATMPCFRKHVTERMRKTVVERNTSRRELKVALANVFTGAFLITWWRDDNKYRLLLNSAVPQTAAHKNRAMQSSLPLH